MRYLFFLLFLFLGLQSKCQEPTDPSMLIKINDILPYYNFEKIRTYIWVNGDRKTYCPNYSDNPHLGLTDMNTDIYYNPSQKRDNLVESDYNIMFITSKLKGTPFNYYVYLGNSGNTYLYDYNKVLEKESDKEQALDKLKKIIDVMMIRANPKGPK